MRGSDGFAVVVQEEAKKAGFPATSIFSTQCDRL